MPKIKICGLSCPEDITYINEAKPDYCGFIIDVPKSRRNVSVSKDLDAAAASNADLILLDHGKGGTGETFDWSLLEGWTKRPYFLAGGLNPENIPEAIQRIHPWGIDLSSAVETDGKKDREKILQAVKTVRNFESSKH